jgi:hypothetical protein
MFWKWFWKVLALLLVVAIFVGASIAIYQAGYAQGVSANIRMSEDGAPALPYTGLYYRPLGFYRPFFPGLGLFFGFILMLTLFGAIGRMARYSHWKSKGMPDPRYWGHGWHRWYPHPDCKGEDRGSGEPAIQGDPEEEAASTA